MKKSIIEKYENLQKLPLSKVWQGRITNDNLGHQYYYQAVKLSEDKSENKPVNQTVGLIGYSCDAGVKRNQGRVGAKFAPNAIRSKLAKLAYHHQDKIIHDYGNITCIDDELETCQANFSNAICDLINKGIFPIAIGGGHDIAYAHYKGIWNAVQNKQQRISIINFDAHFDLRPILSKGNSGTPFNQILSEFDTRYMAIGIQQQANTKELFTIADQNSVSYIEAQDCILDKLSEVFKKIDKFLQLSDALYLSIDMDGFSSAVAPGVSAPSPLGMQPRFVTECLDYIFRKYSVISCDFAETNPLYDRYNQTSLLAAQLIDTIIKMKK